MIKMKALDTMHVSNAQADNLLAGDEFTVSEAEAKQLEDRKLAKRIGAAKEAEAPANKMQAAPENKSVISSIATKPARKGK